MKQPNASAKYSPTVLVASAAGARSDVFVLLLRPQLYLPRWLARRSDP